MVNFVIFQEVWFTKDYNVRWEKRFTVLLNVEINHLFFHNKVVP